jgi:hypothetical protein
MMTKRQHPKNVVLGNVARLHPARRPPSPPEHLEEPERQLWIQLTARFEFDDVASLELLNAALEARCRSRRCRISIEKDGEVWLDHHGDLRPHPLLAAERSARAHFLQCVRALRLDEGLGDDGPAA